MDFIFLIILILLIWGPEDIFRSDFLDQPALTIGEFQITYFTLIIISLTLILIVRYIAFAIRGRPTKYEEQEED